MPIEGHRSCEQEFKPCTGQEPVSSPSDTRFAPSGPHYPIRHAGGDETSDAEEQEGKEQLDHGPMPAQVFILAFANDRV